MVSMLNNVSSGSRLKFSVQTVAHANGILGHSFRSDLRIAVVVGAFISFVILFLS